MTGLTTRRGFLASCLAAAGAMLLPAAEAAGWWSHSFDDVAMIRWESMGGIQRNFKIMVVMRGDRPVPNRTLVCRIGGDP